MTRCTAAAVVSNGSFPTFIFPSVATWIRRIAGLCWPGWCLGNWPSRSITKGCAKISAPIVPSRTALGGALLVKEWLGLTDRETVAAIQENPYLQFFIGCEEFTSDRPFDASLMVDFRKRFGETGMQRIGEAIALGSLQKTEQAPAEPSDDDHPPQADDNWQETSSEGGTEAHVNRGQLIADATCTPADIRYPTDVSLLNEAREKTDEILDELHTPLVGKEPRPRTYRLKARHAFVAFAKRKQPGRRAIRRAKRQQLGFLHRNLRAINRLLESPGACRSLTSAAGFTRTCWSAAKCIVSS